MGFATPDAHLILLEIRQMGSAAAIQQYLGGAQLLVEDRWLCTVKKVEASHHIAQHGYYHLIVQHHLLATKHGQQASKHEGQLLVKGGRLCAVKDLEASHHIPQVGNYHPIVQHNLHYLLLTGMSNVALYRAIAAM